MRDKLYFPDYPVKDLKDDYVGFEEQIEMIKEGIESNSRIVGLVADYGSGKSSIIELLKKELDEEEYDIVKINLLDPDGQANEFEAHKRLLIQLANHKYKNELGKLSYITKRLNPNYKSVDISTKNKISTILICVSLLLFVISFLYKNNLLSYMNFLPTPKYNNLVTIIKQLCNLSGIIGFIILFITIIKSEIVCNYLKKDSEQELNELDLIEISKILINDKKTTVIVIEDLDRNGSMDVEKFIKELISFYTSMEKCKFVIAVTPEELLNMSNDENDNKYKPFGLIVDLPKIKNSDYGVILKELLLSRKELYKEYLDIQNENEFDLWYWLSISNNMNLRRLKHRINSTIHLYMTLKTRFPGKDIQIKTCIAIVYLKDEYGVEFNNLIDEKKGKGFALKNKLEKFIIKDVRPETDNLLDKDIYDLFKGGYINHNCEMYCFNYSKYNTIFNVDENEIYNDYLCDRNYKLDDSKIKQVISANPECIRNAINMRNSLNIGIPNNVFERGSIINYIIDNVSSDELMKMYKSMLFIDNNHINTTIVRLNKLKGTQFYDDDNIKFYVDIMDQQLMGNGNLELIDETRLKLLDFFKNKIELLKKLYGDNYPIITLKEINKINNLSVVIKLLDFNKITESNVNYIVDGVDQIYKCEEELNLITFINQVPSELKDYIFKNCKSISKLNESTKIELFNNNKDLIDLDDIEDIEKLVSNMQYSFDEVESEVINLFNNKKIAPEQYQLFVNKIPNVHECTLIRLLEDDCRFTINDNLINKLKNDNKMYGYIKFRILKEGKIPREPEAIEQFENIYSNVGDVFNEYMSDEFFLKYIRDKEIYKKYDNHKFMLLSECIQTYDLLAYAFENLELNMLEDYIQKIDEIKCNIEELSNLLSNYNNKIKHISEDVSKKLYSFMEGRSLKARYRAIRRKANV